MVFATAIRGVSQNDSLFDHGFPVLIAGGRCRHAGVARTHTTFRPLVDTPVAEELVARWFEFELRIGDGSCRRIDCGLVKSGASFVACPTSSSVKYGLSLRVSIVQRHLALGRVPGELGR